MDLVEEAFHSYKTARHYFLNVLSNTRTVSTFLESLKKLKKAYEDIFAVFIALKKEEIPKSPFLKAKKAVELFPELESHYEYYLKIKKWLNAQNISGREEGSRRFYIIIVTDEGKVQLTLKEMKKVITDLEELMYKLREHLREALREEG